jgi:hypothetical protein
MSVARAQGLRLYFPDGATSNERIEENPKVIQQARKFEQGEDVASFAMLIGW